MSLNATEYLQKQRKWAETGAVRDLEFEGDTILKTLSSRCKNGDSYLRKYITALSAAAEIRWRAIDKKVGDLWCSPLHWKLSQYNDQKGRRVVLVTNSKFDSHDSASYELMMGINREEEKQEIESNLQNELSDLMKRNSEAIVPYYESATLEDDNEDDKHVSSQAIEQSHSDYMSTMTGVTTEESASENFDTDVDVDEDKDEWARAFIWQDNETIVAR